MTGILLTIQPATRWKCTFPNHIVPRQDTMIFLQRKKLNDIFSVSDHFTQRKSNYSCVRELKTELQRHGSPWKPFFFCVQHIWPFIPQQSVNMGFLVTELSILGLRWFIEETWFKKKKIEGCLEASFHNTEQKILTDVRHNSRKTAQHKNQMNKKAESEKEKT